MAINNNYKNESDLEDQKYADTIKRYSIRTNIGMLISLNILLWLKMLLYEDCPRKMGSGLY